MHLGVGTGNWVGDGELGGGGAHYRLIERFMNALNSIEVERLLCKSEKRVEH